MNIVVSIVVYSLQLLIMLITLPVIPYLIWRRGLSLRQIERRALVIVTDILYFLILSVIFPFLLYRMYTKHKYWDTLKERMGGIGHLPKKKNTIWIHGASVGEIKGARGLVQKLRDEAPAREIIISAVSTAGKKVAAEMYPDCLVISFPLDFSWVVSRYIRHFDPALVILIELEIWPNFLQLADQKQIPVVLVNGRLSQRSFRGYYRYLRGLFPEISRPIVHFAMQNEVYLQRFLDLGIPKERLLITGNMKFDAINPEKWLSKKEALCQQLDIQPHFKVLVMGSSHAEEEEILLSCYRRLIADFSEVRAIIVPRHPDRKDEIARVVERHGLLPVKKSEILNGQFHFQENHIVIGDIMGELAEIYTVAYITIIGGSFVPHGGQNFIEPASLEKTVVCGPFMFNFPEIAAFLEQNALVQLKSADQVYQTLVELLKFPEKVQDMGAKACQLIKQSQGSSQRNCDLCLKALNKFDRP